MESINHPQHYGGKDNPYEAIKVIEAWDSTFCIGNVIKYISRAGKKDQSKELEDLKKALWYLQREISKKELKIELDRKLENDLAEQLVDFNDLNDEKTEDSVSTHFSMNRSIDVRKGKIKTHDDILAEEDYCLRESKPSGEWQTEKGDNSLEYKEESPKEENLRLKDQVTKTAIIIGAGF